MPSARYLVGAGVIGAALYVIGGSDGATATTTLQVYNPNADTWSTKASMTTARLAPAAASFGGKLYVAGGLSTTNVAVTTLEAYDALTNTWSTKAPMPTARYGGSATVLEGLLYVAGGAGTNGVALKTVEVYDPCANSWSTVPSMSTARIGAAAVAMSGKVFVVGGGAGGSTFLSSVEAYSPVSGLWGTESASMPTARDELSASAAEMVGRLFVAGGLASGGQSNALESYDPSGGTWDTRPAMPTIREGAGACSIDGRFYVVGGRGSGNVVLGVVEAFTPGEVVASAPPNEVTIDEEMLSPPAPNPFAPRTKLSFALAAAGAVELDIRDVSGRMVRQLLREHLEVGNHEVSWDACDASRRPLPAGTYFCMLMLDGRLMGSTKAIHLGR